MTRLEVIKTNMEENIKALIRLQEEQLKAYEEILKSNSLDEADEMIQEYQCKFDFATVLKDIEVEEKENFKNLMNLAWEGKSYAN